MTEKSVRSRTAIIIEFVIPFCVMVIGTVACLKTDLDLELSRKFFSPSLHGWPAAKSSIISLTYKWGPVFSALTAFWALFHFFASYMHPKFWSKRAVSLFILLCIIIGPVVMVNGVGKESWRRPRPRDIIEFGGTHQFRKVLEFGNREYRGKSFPGGHASAGFILVLFYFLLKSRRPRMAWLALFSAITWGSWLSYVRIALGGHFFSDNLYAFGINWFVVWGLYYWWYIPYCRKRKPQRAFSPSRRRYMTGGALLLITGGLLVFRFLFDTPFRIDYPIERTKLPQEVNKLTIKVRAKKGDITIRHGLPGQIGVQTWISGQALPDIQAKRRTQITKQGPDKWEFLYTVEPQGFFYEYQSHNSIYVPPDLNIDWDLFTKQGAIFREDLRVNH